jgi:hypothetical protein
MCKNVVRRLLLAAIGLLALTPALPAQTTAFLGVQNATKDPRMDYLAPIIEGTLLYDLSVRGNLPFVERTRIDAILREQDLQLAGITDPAKMAGAGRILNADWLLSGTYSLAGSDVFASFALVEVETGASLTFTDRGTGENLIHRIAERIISRLSKRSVILAEDGAERSILSLRDERPGTIVLYSRMQQARIYIDDEFVGFTQGKEQDGLVFDSLPPGKHTVRTHLSKDFGVIELSDLSFRDWQKVVEVKAGRRVALIDGTYDLYHARQLAATIVDQRATADLAVPGGLSTAETFRYTDPAGVAHDISLAIVVAAAPVPAGGAPAPLKAVLRLDGKESVGSLAFPSAEQRKATLSLALGKVSLLLTLNHFADEWALDRELTRTDIPERPRRVNAPAPRN